jgi:putative tryptophan/tyrosine transport system substrate-binding protein
MAAVGSCIGPLTADAQAPGKLPKVGLLFLGTSEAGASRWAAFREALRELRWIEGQDILLEYRHASGDLYRVKHRDELVPLAVELAQQKVDAIVAFGTLASLAARQATTTIPIVMTAAQDPVGSGLAASLARPRGNVTGVTLDVLDQDLDAKRLELIKAALPKVSRVVSYTLGAEDSPNHQRQMSRMEAVAPTLGLELFAGCWAHDAQTSRKVSAGGTSMNPKRSTLIRLAVLGALLWIGLPGASLAQTQDKPLRVGLIAFGKSEMSGHLWQTLTEGLRQRGYVEGRNLQIVRGYAEGRPERVPEVASELAGLKLDMIITTCTPSTKAMHNATQTIPLVMAAVSDPVGQGLIASYPRPGGNITGVASQFEDVAAKMLQLFLEAVPKVSPLAVAFNPKNPVHKVFLKEIEAAAKSLNVDVSPVEIGKEADIAVKFDGASPRRFASLMVLPDDPFFLHLRQHFVEMAAKHRMPSFFGINEAVEDGGLMSYGQTLGQAHFRAAYYVDMIAKGAKPADLPVEQPTKFELVINLKTAKALGLTIPQSILIRADEVIR